MKHYCLPLLLALLLSACGTAGDSDHDKDHEHEHQHEEMNNGLDPRNMLLDKPPVNGDIPMDLKPPM